MQGFQLDFKVGLQIVNELIAARRWTLRSLNVFVILATVTVDRMHVAVVSKLSLQDYQTASANTLEPGECCQILGYLALDHAPFRDSSQSFR